MKKILVTVAAVIFTVTMTVYFSAANAADTTGTTNSKTYQKNGERPEPPEFNGKDGQNGERPEPPEFNGKDEK